MKKLIILALGFFLALTQSVWATPASSEVNGTINTGVSTGLEIGLPCSPASVSNGTVNATTCAITCNAGYTLSGNSCIITPSSGGGGGGGGGGGYISSTSTITVTNTTVTGSINISTGSLTSTGNGDTKTTSATLTTSTTTTTLKSSDSSPVSLNIPSGTTVTGNANWNGSISAPVIKSQTDSLIVIEVGNKDSTLTFNKPVTIEINTSLPEGSEIAVYTSHDGKNWELQGSAKVVNGKISFLTNHFSYFALKTTSVGTGSTVSGTGVTTTSSGIVSTTQVIFSDIADSFAKDDIILLSSKGIIKGFSDKTFRPDNKITRAEFLGMVMKALNITVDENVTSSDFTDIPSDGTWMIKYIVKAKELNIANGQTIKGKLVFRPNDPISRAEAVAILLNTAKITVDSTITQTEFTDVSVEWMIPYIAKAKELGIVGGQTINGKLMFRPNDGITRAETSRILTKTMK